ncbi:malate dehydrogenase, putative [Schistosoma mansoni]|uniref:malate dehydrogenase, putative n=1 Tax=Schistosoma mansoni TaxID=6183 RepID=UPI0001A62982|nr:malate dehydrogenase, putative [Schistosoma mansoni]|eukprot:XP_018647253.1 malate dehydrogenase, putative [Schistosoma mansoni]
MNDTGKCNCPFYARIELLADKLSLNLPNFRVTKIVKQPQDWKEFTEWITKKHGWFVEESPVVWRELVDQGGKGILIGGANEFQELVAAYYGEQTLMRTDEMLNIMKDNIKYKIQEDQEQQMKINNTPSPSNVIVIGAAGFDISDFLANILNGEVFGDEMIELYLNDEVKNKNKLFELREVLEEAALPKLSRVHISDDVDECLTHAKQVIILDVIPREGPSFSDIRTQDEWEPRNEWLLRRFLYFDKLGQKMKQKCPKSVRVLLAGNIAADTFFMEMTTPTCFDVTTLHRRTKGKIPPAQIVGLVKPLELRARAAVAKHLKVRTYDVTDVVIWGNLGSSVSLDLSRSCVSCRRHFDAGVVGGNHIRLPALSVAENPQWLRKELLSELRKANSTRKPEYIGLLYENAMTECLKECWNSNQNDPNQITSLVMISRDWYGVPEGIAFSFPVICGSYGCWSIVEDMLLTPEVETQLKTSIRSVLEDWAVVDPLPLEEFLRKDQKPKDSYKEYQAQDNEEN